MKKIIVCVLLTFFLLMTCATQVRQSYDYISECKVYDFSDNFVTSHPSAPWVRLLVFYYPHLAKKEIRVVYECDYDYYIEDEAISTVHNCLEYMKKETGMTRVFRQNTRTSYRKENGQGLAKYEVSALLLAK